MNETTRTCELCGQPGATAPLHLQTNVGTFLMVGSLAHPLCIVALAAERAS